MSNFFEIDFAIETNKNKSGHFDLSEVIPKYEQKYTKSA